MKHTIKLLEAIRSIAIIAAVAVIGFSMAGCGLDDYNNNENNNNNKPLFFPEVLAGDNPVLSLGVSWDKDGGSIYVNFRNDAYQGKNRAYFSIGSSVYHLNAKNEDTYTVRRGWEWNEEENEYDYTIFSFTAIVGEDGKLTISNATLIKDNPTSYGSIAQEVNDLNGVYTKKED